MKIGELKEEYPRLYEIAFNSARNYEFNKRKTDIEIDDSSISYMDDWSRTDQGVDFWSLIDYGNVWAARSKYPEWEHLFNIDSTYLTTKNNGLWQQQS